MTKETFNRPFEEIKFEVWQFILYNYTESFSAREIADSINKPYALVQQVLRKLSLEERTICNKDKKWGIRWPPDPRKHGATVSQAVAIEFSLFLIKMGKEGKIKKGTKMFEDAKRAYRVMLRYVTKGPENETRDSRTNLSEM